MKGTGQAEPAAGMEVDSGAANQGGLYNYVVTAHKPTAVSHAAMGSFTSPTDVNLIIGCVPDQKKGSLAGLTQSPAGAVISVKGAACLELMFSKPYVLASGQFSLPLTDRLFTRLEIHTLGANGLQVGRREMEECTLGDTEALAYVRLAVALGAAWPCSCLHFAGRDKDDVLGG